MIGYYLGILSLIWYLLMAHPIVTEPWYADDAGAGGTFMVIQQHLDDLMVQGSLWGYFLEPKNIILFVSPRNFLLAEAFFQGYGLQVVTGSR